MRSNWFRIWEIFSANPISTRYSLWLLLLLFLLPSCHSGSHPSSGGVVRISGRVVDPEGTGIPGAVVRIKAGPDCVWTGRDGEFGLSYAGKGGGIHLTAWKEGYYIGGLVRDRRAGGLEIVLHPHQEGDNSRYQWLQPVKEERSTPGRFAARIGLFLANNAPFSRVFHSLNESMSTGCADCHGLQMHTEWVSSAHALGNRNPRFMSMYNGTDVHGNKSPLTAHLYSRDYGTIPLRPLEDTGFRGPGYRLDFPGSAGNCATCHLPAAALQDPYGMDPNEAEGIDCFGSHCDFCHKIDQVVLDPGTHAPFDNRPGILSYTFKRPFGEDQIFFGPFDDVDAGTDVCLPLQRKSEFCAGCHDAGFWGVPVYKSYSEWMESPYPDSGITCQDCHMKPDGVTTNFAAGRGGVERDPQTIATHAFEGGLDRELLQNAVTMSVELESAAGRLVLEVVILNDRTGHHVPTDSPLRHLILVVDAATSGSSPPELCRGPVIPEWGGVPGVAEGNYAGKPGKIFAKVLEEKWTGISPTGSYWNPTRIVSDNRLEAFVPDTSRFLFLLADSTGARFDISLIYRRAPLKLMLQKDWNTPDILMEEASACWIPDRDQG